MSVAESAEDQGDHDHSHDDSHPAQDESHRCDLCYVCMCKVYVCVENMYVFMCVCTVCMNSSYIMCKCMYVCFALRLFDGA